MLMTAVSSVFSAVLVLHVAVVGSTELGEAEWNANTEAKNHEFDYVQFEMTPAELEIARTGIRKVEVAVKQNMATKRSRRRRNQRQRRLAASQAEESKHQPVMNLYFVRATEFDESGKPKNLHLVEPEDFCAGSTLEHPQVGITASHCFRELRTDVNGGKQMMANPRELKNGKNVLTLFVYAHLNNKDAEEDQHIYMRVVTAWWYSKAFKAAYEKPPTRGVPISPIVDYAFIWLDRPAPDGVFYSLHDPDDFPEAEKAPVVEAIGFGHVQKGPYGFRFGTELLSMATLANDFFRFRQTAHESGPLQRGCSGGPWVIHNNVALSADRQPTGRGRLIGVTSAGNADMSYVLSFKPNPGVAKCLIAFVKWKLPGFVPSQTLKALSKKSRGQTAACIH